MSSTIVRADHEQLLAIARVFEQHSTAIETILKQIMTSTDTLRGGNWVGQGAIAFYSEMDGHVLPSLKRLTGALEEAARVTKQINALMQQAEQDAAACFRLDATHSVTGIGDMAGAIGGAEAASSSHNASRVQSNWPTNMGQLYNEISKLTPQRPVKVLQVGPNEYVVLVRGTDGGPYSENWGGALDSGLTGYSDYIRQVRQYVEATVPAGANIHVIGHSQGGNSITNLADDGAFRERYTIESVTTFGSAQPPFKQPGIDYHSISDAGDAVPHLDRTALNNPVALVQHLWGVVGNTVSEFKLNQEGKTIAHLNYANTAANLSLPAGLNIQQWSEVPGPSNFDWQPHNGLASLWREGVQASQGNIVSGMQLPLDLSFEIDRTLRLGVVNNSVLDQILSSQLLPIGARNALDNYRDRIMDTTLSLPPPSQMLGQAGQFMGQFFNRN